MMRGTSMSLGGLQRTFSRDGKRHKKHRDENGGGTVSGKKVMKSILMAPGTFTNGSPQDFYFPTSSRE